MKLKREERYISYFHKPIAQGWTTPYSSWRRWRCRWGRWRPRRQRSAGVFALQSTAPDLCFGVSVFSAASSPKGAGRLFLYSFLGQDEASERKIDGNGATRVKMSGPTRPRNLAAWAYLFWPSGFHFFASFAPTLSSFQKMILVKFQVNWTSFGSLKHQNIENRVFCQCSVNSRKIDRKSVV